jgi:hypothetical protein
VEGRKGRGEDGVLAVVERLGSVRSGIGARELCVLPFCDEIRGEGHAGDVFNREGTAYRVEASTTCA